MAAACMDPCKPDPPCPCSASASPQPWEHSPGVQVPTARHLQTRTCRPQSAMAPCPWLAGAPQCQGDWAGPCPVRQHLVACGLAALGRTRLHSHAQQCPQLSQPGTSINFPIMSPLVFPPLPPPRSHQPWIHSRAVGSSSSQPHALSLSADRADLFKRAVMGALSIPVAPGLATGLSQVGEAGHCPSRLPRQLPPTLSP